MKKTTIQIAMLGIGIAFMIFGKGDTGLIMSQVWLAGSMIVGAMI